MYLDLPLLLKYRLQWAMEVISQETTRAYENQVCIISFESNKLSRLFRWKEIKLISHCRWLELWESSTTKPSTISNLRFQVEHLQVWQWVSVGPQHRPVQDLWHLPPAQKKKKKEKDCVYSSIVFLYLLNEIPLFLAGDFKSC